MARLFHRLLALAFLDAFVSLGRQVLVLVGRRGLLPAAAWLDAARPALSFFELPTIFWWLRPADAALLGGCAVGGVLAALALAGVRPRLCFALLTALYLSYASIGRAFLSFQWDNLILECGWLAALLPERRFDGPARAVHLLLKLVAFKLYFESGLAKAQSALGDWWDGSAMTWYYETAPLPGRLAWWFHHLPARWHHLESWTTLALELAVPFLFFAPRRGRLFALVTLTAFQLVNFATANYGFFVPLALCLHVFLLDEADLARVRAALSKRVPRLALRAPPEPAAARWREMARKLAAALSAIAFAVPSTVDGLAELGERPGYYAQTQPLRRLWEPWRLVSTYHLFGSITRSRIEPQLETFDGTAWTEHDLRYEPGDPARAPATVAPHQPRVDFQLWFYGLSYQRGAPEYVVALVERLCRDPAAVQPLFPQPLPAHPEAVRISFWRYHFTTREERARTGAWWTREKVGESAPISCGGASSPP